MKENTVYIEKAEVCGDLAPLLSVVVLQFVDIMRV